MKNQPAFLELGRPVRSRGWRIEASVRAVAGSLIVASVVLCALVSPWWLLLTLFVGLNLMQSAVTGWCLMSNLIAVAFPRLGRA